MSAPIISLRATRAALELQRAGWRLQVARDFCDALEALPCSVNRVDARRGGSEPYPQEMAQELDALAQAEADEEARREWLEEQWFNERERD